MQSAWMARVYVRCWRPALFALSTGFGAPSSTREGGLVVERLQGCRGPTLDLSCGPGVHTQSLIEAAPAQPVVALDVSRAMLARVRATAPGALRVRADALDLPFEDASFGAVVNLAALDLYLDPARVVAEASRVLRPGGRWIVTTFVARRTGRRRLGTRWPTIDRVARWAAEAGLVRLGTVRFRHYLLAWADKGPAPLQDEAPR